MDADMLCKYPSRNCQNPRSLKISGELHHFCITHRWKANAAQRRWTSKRREDGGKGKASGNRKRGREDPETGSSDEEGSEVALLGKVPRVEAQLGSAPLLELHTAHSPVLGQGDSWEAPVLNDLEFAELCASFLEEAAGESNSGYMPPAISFTAAQPIDCWWDPNYIHYRPQKTTVSTTEWQF